MTVKGDKVLEIKSVNLKSLFKLSFIFYLVVMVIVGFFGLLFMLFGLVTNFSTTQLTAALGAIVIYVLVSLFYGLMAAVFMFLSGLVYNKLANRFGGIKIETRESE